MNRSGTLVVVVFLSSLLVLCRGQQCRLVLWEPAPNDNSLESSTPLGFRSEILPGDDSEDPDPCVRVFYPNETSNNYIQVLVESPSRVCVRFRGGEENTCNAPFCSTAVPLSTDAMNRSYVDILFFCTAGCSSADTSFFYKVENTSLAVDDEFWCDSRNTDLPSSLRTGPTINVQITEPPRFTDGQPCTVWAPAPVQTNPASLTNPGGTPLGFRSLTLPGAGSQNQGRCVRVFYDNTTNTDYIFVAVEPEQGRLSLCVRFVGALSGDCGSGGTFFCKTAAIPLTTDPTTTRRYVDVELSCSISCMSSNITIFYRVETASPDVNDPSWCRNRNRTLPSSLRSTSGTDPSSTVNVTDGASTLTALTSLSILLVTLAALLFH